MKLCHMGLLLLAFSALYGKLNDTLLAPSVLQLESFSVYKELCTTELLFTDEYVITVEGLVSFPSHKKSWPKSS